MAYLMLIDLKKATVIGSGIYEDVIVKTPEGWRFKSRVFHNQFAPPAEAAATPAAPAAK